MVGVAQGPWGHTDHQQDERLHERSGEAVRTSLETLQTVSPSTWQGRDPPRRDWMVDKCFLKGTVALVSGDGGIGKSLLMQQLASCAVLGRSWIGLSLQPGRALYLACEDDHDELWRRQAAINRSLGAEMDDMGEGGLILAPRVGQDNTLMRLERKEWRMMPTRLFDAVKARCRKDGISYLIVDTATQTFAGNQNDETQVTAYIAEMRRLAIAIQGVVIVTKHPSMAGRALGTGESGNVAWHNSCRSRFYLHKPTKGGALCFESKKSNYGPSDLVIALHWEQGTYVLDQPEPPPAWRRYGD